MTASAESPVEIVRRLPPAERRVLAALDEGQEPVPLDHFVERGAFKSETEAYSACSWLSKKGLVEIQELPERMVRLGAEGKRFLDGLPEERVHAYVRRNGNRCTLSQLNAEFGEATMGVALAWWKRKGLGGIERATADTVLVAADSPPAAEDALVLRELASAPEAGRVEGDLRGRFPRGFENLRQRPGVLDVYETKRRRVGLTDLGHRVKRGGLEAAVEVVGELTPELVVSGAFRGKEFQAYDVSTAAPRTAAAKPHPLVQIIEEVRAIFVELGFSEIEEEYVQSAFWNMDALFIPQDHPAREMQDTFYLESPKRLEVPADLFETVSKVHESGGGTGSRGWRAALDPEESRRALLRTHTTVGTIRYLAKNPPPPVRVFSIGRVFRHETMDATHLPEFHQIEGIATEPGADFRMLLGILQEFYRRLGFPKLRWRPAYFPYTEPSMEVEVWTGAKWMELGGCGIFRPEVTRPFGVKTPVLAWGLGLERLAMMRLGLKDIRDLYISDLEWLRNQPLQ